MGNPYPAEFIDANDQVRAGLLLNFTDPDNQPGGGGSLPEGWTQQDDPARVNTNGGTQYFNDPENTHQTTIVSQGGFETADDEADFGSFSAADGFQSSPTGTTAYTAADDNGATVALDAGGLPVINLPTVDPGIAGALWNDSGTPAISMG